MAVKSLSQIRHNMLFVPIEKKPSQVEILSKTKRQTKGLFADSTPIMAQEHSTIDKNWLEKANPQYAQDQRDKAAREKHLFVKR